ncbi:MAG: hypothetical protein R3236_08375 [Phycisphaeraceae bacterium]|nr:hypothetical protein [Phycisphaeraceae bacterium]
MSRTPVSLPQRRRFGQTSRKDAWWLQPVAVFIGLGIFIVYSTWAAFQGEHYFLTSGGQNYLSPFYSPVLFDAPGQVSGHAWFGPWPAFLDWLPVAICSPALLILWAPGGFRFTCYYYRGAYYKAFWADPPSCAVGEPRTSYLGENSLPLILQNVHRYFLYLAVVFIFILSYDAFAAMWFVNEAGDKTFGIGLGTIVLTLNAVFLACYTFGCHSFRHLVGGKKDCLSKAPMGRKAYDCSSCLNKKHMLFAWISLFWVGFTDFYVRMCSMGIWSDWRIL